MVNPQMPELPPFRGVTAFLQWPLDLLQKDDLEQLLLILREQPDFADPGMSRVERGLRTFVRHGRGAKLMRVSNIETLRINCRGDHVIEFWLRDVIDAGNKLEDMAKCPDFDLLAAQFDNPEDFGHSLMLEIAAAHKCWSSPAVSQFRFHPLHEIKGKNKRSDFEFMLSGITYCCECKTRNSMDNIFERRINHLWNALTKTFSGINIHKDLRVDLVLKNRLVGNLSQTIQMLANEIIKVLQGGQSDPANYAPFHFRVKPRRERPDWDGYDTRRALTCVTPMPLPDGVTCLDESDGTGWSPNAWLTLAANNPNAATEVGDLLNEAKDQIPQHRKGLVFLRGVTAPSASLAVERRIHEKAYKHIAAVIVDASPITVISMAENGRILEPIFGTDISCCDMARMKSMYS